MNSTEFKLSSLGLVLLHDTVNHVKRIVEDKNMQMIYISGPVSGIDNYIDKFEEVFIELTDKTYLSNYYIFNPMRTISSFPETLSYIERMIIMNEVLKYADTLVLDDRTDKWKESKGCLSELSIAQNNNINILSYSKILKGEYF